METWLSSYQWRGEIEDEELSSLTQSYGGRASLGWWDRFCPNGLGWICVRHDDRSLEAVPDTRPPTTVASTATTSPTAPSTTVPERLTGASRLSLDGIGPVRIGMTSRRPRPLPACPFGFFDMPPGPECRYAVPDRASGTGDELAFMIYGGRIVRVDVGIMGPDRIRTVSGRGKGNTEAEVQATYPGRIRVEPHPYTPEGRYLVYVPSDPGMRHLSLIFATVHGEVRSFRAGLAEQVSWKEGCSWRCPARQRPEALDPIVGDTGEALVARLRTDGAKGPPVPLNAQSAAPAVTGESAGPRCARHVASLRNSWRRPGPATSWARGLGELPQAYAARPWSNPGAPSTGPS